MMPTSLTFFVPGLPRPKGSAKFLPIVRKFPLTVVSAKDLNRCGRITSTTEGLQDWERSIGWAAYAARGSGKPAPLCGYEVLIRFDLPKPKRPVFDRPIVRPDVDKLTRAVCDALTGVLWHDDAQVLRITAEKAYVDNVANIGASITVTALAVTGTGRTVKAPRLPKAEQLPLLTEAADDF